MKKTLAVLALSTLFFACSQSSDATKDTELEMKQQKVEQSIEELDKTLESSESKLEENQSEIDSLLKDI
ncbi:hypothetical protein [Luteibaculum oceani]|uniref:Lipoprotein n=1 Tax=Luteibaculum oceani TaxID=1294296 RepID=A0A5C6V9D9_9FLAO|nr:hypothetical protein [Luteibaculum oceani]TXC82092.1 hypothetical protein FRX97_03085 [Luteibaculum oceani]